MVRRCIAAWNSRSGIGLLANIAFSVGLALVANVFILIVNPAEQTQAPTYRFQPPGFVIGVVWTLLFAAMGMARWLVIKNEDGSAGIANQVVVLIAFCASYPLYTLGLRSLTIGLIGNVATILLALWVARRTRTVSMPAALLLCAPAVWVSFASYLVLEQMLGRSI